MEVEVLRKPEHIGLTGNLTPHQYEGGRGGVSLCAAPSAFQVRVPDPDQPPPYLPPSTCLPVVQRLRNAQTHFPRGKRDFCRLLRNAIRNSSHTSYLPSRYWPYLQNAKSPNGERNSRTRKRWGPPPPRRRPQDLTRCRVAICVRCQGTRTRQLAVCPPLLEPSPHLTAVLLRCGMGSRYHGGVCGWCVGSGYLVVEVGCTRVSSRSGGRGLGAIQDKSPRVAARMSRENGTTAVFFAANRSTIICARAPVL